MSLVYDPRRPEILADPYPVLHHLQDEDPVHWRYKLGELLRETSDQLLLLTATPHHGDGLGPRRGPARGHCGALLGSLD